MTTTVWGAAGSTGAAQNSGQRLVQEFTLGAPQSLFTLTLFSYIPGTSVLTVLINGVRQRLTTDYTETSGTSFTLVENALTGDTVTAVLN